MARRSNNISNSALKAPDCGRRRTANYTAGVLATLALVGAATASRVRAQQVPPPNVPSATLRVTSRLVMVDAVVTDKDGHPVKGLTAADFNVTENKKPQKISTFAFQELASNPMRSAPGALPPNVTTNRSEYVTPPGPPTVLLLDALNTQALDQGYARLQLIKYINTQLTPGQPVAVYTLGRSLRVLQDFTNDPRLLRLAVESFVPQKSINLEIEDISSRLPPASRILGTGGLHNDNTILRAQGMLEVLNDFYFEQAQVVLDDRVGITLGAFRIIARAMAGMPGRKNLVWVSGSFPLTLMKQIVHYGDTPSDPNYKSVEKQYEDVIRQASSFLTDAQVSLYGVDAHGLVGSTGADASTQGTNDLGLLKSGGEYGADVTSGHANLENTQASMALLASETGGRLFANRNDIDHAVEESIADGSVYYLIGYYPEDKGWDGKFHTIQVSVNKPGLIVRSRKGYYATDPAQWSKDNRNKDADLSVQMALINPIATMIIFDARAMPPAAVGGKVKVPIDFLVDSHTLSYEDDKGSRKYELDFHAAAYGKDGKVVSHADVGTKAGVKAENVAALEQGGFPYHMELELPAGQYMLRLGVRDVRTGFIGTADLPMTIGK